VSTEPAPDTVEDDEARLASLYDLLMRRIGPEAADDPELAVAVALANGGRLSFAGDLDGARAAYRSAIDSPYLTYGDAVTIALFLLGVDDKAGAAAACRRVLDSDADLVVRDLSVLERLLERAGDTESVEIVLRRILDAGQPETAPLAAYDLGRLLDKRDELLPAMEATAYALKHGDSRLKPRAMVLFGWLQERNGNWEGGIWWYSRTIESGHDDAAPRARLGLARLLLRKFNDEDRARELLREAIDSGHPEMAPLAVERLARLDGSG
jgi:hypothetical protein